MNKLAATMAAMLAAPAAGLCQPVTLVSPDITTPVVTGGTLNAPTLWSPGVINPTLTNPVVAGTLALSGNPVTMDPAGNASLRWNAANGQIAVNQPLWNQSTQYAPWKSPAAYNWNFEGINYSVTPAQTSFDAGQTVANYMQMIKEAGTTNVQLWAAVAELSDYTGQGVAANGAEIVQEFDLKGNGSIATGGSRGVIDIVAFQAVATAAPIDAGYAISIHSPPNGGGWFEYGLQVASSISVAGYDSRYAGFMPGAHDIWLGDNRDIAFDSAATNTMLWNPVTAKTEFTGSLFFKNIVQLAAYTVATLPACASWYVGGMASVSDAKAPAYNAPLTGGGTNNIPVYCNGNTWTAH